MNLFVFAGHLDAGGQRHSLQQRSEIHRQILFRILLERGGADMHLHRLARGRRTVGTFSTKKEAEQAERAVLAAKDRNVDLAPTSVEVCDLVERYIRDREARGRCGEKTLEEVYQALEKIGFFRPSRRETAAV